MRYLRSFESKQNEHLDLLNDLFTSISDGHPVNIIEETGDIFSVTISLSVPSIPCSTSDWCKFMETNLSISKKIDEVNNRLDGYDVKCSVTSLPIGESEDGKIKMVYHLDIIFESKKERSPIFRVEKDELTTIIIDYEKIKSIAKRFELNLEDIEFDEPWINFQFESTDLDEDEEDFDLLHDMYSLFYKEIYKIAELKPMKGKGLNHPFEIEGDCVSINFLSYYNYDFDVSCKII